MDSRKRFSALETMCRERAHLAKREFEYWLAEADEWARYRNSTDPSIEAIPTQLDWQSGLCPSWVKRFRSFAARADAKSAFVREPT